MPVDGDTALSAVCQRLKQRPHELLHVLSCLSETCGEISRQAGMDKDVSTKYKELEWSLLELIPVICLNIDSKTVAVTPK